MEDHVRRITVLLSTLTMVALSVPVGAQERQLPEADRDLAAVAEGSTSEALAKVDISLRGEGGPALVSIVLSEEPVATNPGQLRRVEAQQASFIRTLSRLGGVSVASTQRVLNAVFAEVDSAAVEAIAADPSVVSIKRVSDYRLDLTDTVPYIGGTAVHGLGVDGSGVVVAVLDSGVDYTHANLGGPGTVDAYFAAYGENNNSGKNRSTTDRYQGELLFPTDKVIGGFDFVGESWPQGITSPAGRGAGPAAKLRPDPDPIDRDGHGTHVADIIGGENGVAPGAQIFAIKVCSSVTPSCSGVALIQAMDLAVDPDGDGDLSDHVDIINMSLGSLYGQAFDDDLAAAVDNATEAGVLTVASAGNSSNKPYVTGTPAAAPTALSVAQTQVPSAVQPQLTVIAPDNTAFDITAVHQPWSFEPTDVVQGPLVFAGNVEPANNLGCNPFTTDLTGAVVLMERGACNFTLKALNAQNAGAVAAIIGLVAPGDPFAGGDGGDGPITIPAYMIGQQDSNTLEAGTDLTVVVDPALGIPLIGSMVGSSSRGPSMLANLIKPEIGAPGASVSAIVGTGTDTGPFGGTSGAAPMVTGSAALLLDAEPELSPAEVKARLVNTGDTDIDTDPASGLAPVTRIGGGEVRVDRAVGSAVSAWDADALNAALSFGMVDVTGIHAVTKTVHVENYGSSDVEYTITPTFRFSSDETGAVTPSAPTSIIVPAGGSASFDLDLTIDGSLLANWSANSGGAGASPAWLDALEYDGYVVLDAAGEENDIHLPWHVLPRKAGDFALDFDTEALTGTLTNSGVGTHLVEAYNLYVDSPNLPEGAVGASAPIVDLKYVGAQTFGTGFCESGFLLVFAVNTWERQTHANAPALFEFDIDVDGDGTYDYAIFNADLSLASGVFNLSDGRNVIFTQNLATGETRFRFGTDHETNSANTVLFECGERLGLGPEHIGTDIDVQVLAADIYFTGDVTDSAEFTMNVGFERFVPIVDGLAFGGNVGAGETVDVSVLDFGAADSATELGVLLLYRGGAPEGEEADAILVD